MQKLLTYKIKHTYLDKYIKKPMIDEGKLAALSTIVNHTDLSIHVKKQYIITTMLVQIALDTHDQVPIANNDHGEESNVSKQLTVLAGDYYSGLYYLLLAEIKDIHMIRMLAKTIKEISEYKMQLYYKEVDTFANYIALIGKAESLLMTRVAEFVNVPINHEALEKLMVIHKLTAEKEVYPYDNQSSIPSHWLSDHTYTAESVIADYKHQLKQLLSNPSIHVSTFKRQFQYMLKGLIDNYITIAEEG